MANSPFRQPAIFIDLRIIRAPGELIERFLESLFDDTRQFARQHIAQSIPLLDTSPLLVRLHRQNFDFFRDESILNERLQSIEIAFLYLFQCTQYLIRIGQSLIDMRFEHLAQ